MTGKFIYEIKKGPSLREASVPLPYHHVHLNVVINVVEQLADVVVATLAVTASRRLRLHLVPTRVSWQKKQA